MSPSPARERLLRQLAFCLAILMLQSAQTPVAELRPNVIVVLADDGGDYSRPYQDVSRVDYTSPIHEGPVDRGFDHFYGISASLDMPPFVWINDRQATETASVEKTFVRRGPAGAKFDAIDVQGGICDHTIACITQRAAAAKEGRLFFA